MRRLFAPAQNSQAKKNIKKRHQQVSALVKEANGTIKCHIYIYATYLC